MNFLKAIVAAMIGSAAGLFLAFFLFFLFLAGVSSSIMSGISKKEEVKVEANTVLKLDLSYAIPERTSEDPFANINFNTLEVSKQLGLNDILASIKAAKDDDNVKGLYLDLSTLPSGMATTEAIRKALIDFKTSEKFIVAYGEVLTQKAYYLASVADEIYVNPVGYMELKGFSTQLMFFKNMLDRLGIETQVFYAGKYKSATEPLRYTEMSDPNREQVSDLLEGVYDHFLTNIVAERELSYAMLDSVCDNLLVREPKDALIYNLIDGVAYYDEVLENLMSKTGADELDDLEMMSLGKYASAAKPDVDFKVKDKIAVLYASGSIVDGEGEEDNIGSKRFASALRDIRENEDIKALVIRVNSGGGSALASEVMLREIQLIKAKMPVIVSMGDVAASGGYYIASFADTILAEPNTITGSIGVFGVIPNMQTFFNEKLGITFDGVQTGRFTEMGLLTRPVTPEERGIIQSGVDSVYSKFKSRVAEGRELDILFVDSIAQGHVYTGIQAQKLGLVDVLGGMDEALAFAKEKAGIEDYRVSNYPKVENPLNKFFKGMEQDLETRFMEHKLGDFYPMWEKMEEVKSMKGMQARMPFDLVIY